MYSMQEQVETITGIIYKFQYVLFIAFLESQNNMIT